MIDLKFSKILNADTFYSEIEKLVANSELTYMDAIVYFCEKNEMEIETAAALVKGNFRFKSHLQHEGERLNFLPRTAKLPI